MIAWCIFSHPFYFQSTYVTEFNKVYSWGVVFFFKSTLTIFVF